MSQLELKESPLGRGLSDLFGNRQQESSTAEEFQHLHIDLLVPGKYQPRQEFEPIALSELVESIRTQGILQPLLVRKISSDPVKYEIIAGERRWQAAKRAGLNQVPVWIRDIDDQQALAMAIVENLQRRDLNLIEEGQAFKRLIDEFGYTHEQVARSVNKSRSYVSNAMRLLTLPDKIKEGLRQNLITASHARTIINMENAEEVFQQITQNQISVRQIEAIKKKKTTPEQAENKNEDLQVIEVQLTEALQMPVTITFIKGVGELSIKFKNLDQLDQLAERLNKQNPKVWAV